MSAMGHDGTGTAIRPVGEPDRPTVSWLLEQMWGSDVVAVHGDVFRPAELGGLIAERAGRIVGLLTYTLLPASPASPALSGALEIITLNAIEKRTGLGSMLIDAAVLLAREAGCQHIVLSTTNDNLDALRFYQRRGFRLHALRPGAVDRSREVKPRIPHTGEFGIPLRDELDLILPVA